MEAEAVLFLFLCLAKHARWWCAHSAADERVHRGAIRGQEVDCLPVLRTGAARPSSNQGTMHDLARAKRGIECTWEDGGHRPAMRSATRPRHGTRLPASSPEALLVGGGALAQAVLLPAERVGARYG